MASPVIQVKRGLYSNLPALKSGEPGFTTDKYDLFVGLDETLGNNQFFGSGRYWEREDGTNAAQLKLVDKDGSNGINLQVPDTTAGIGTWILPNSNTGSQYGLLAIASTSGDERTLEWTSITTNSFDATTLVIESEGISSNDSDTQIPTTAAVKDYVDTQITAQDLDFAGDTGTGAVDLDSQSFTIAGTSNEIETSASGQTITIGLPDDVTIGQDLTVSRDVQIVRNLNVDGNITVGGTTATLFTQTLKVADADLILGIRTDGSGNDISTDNTANHGGIAIASTEGNSLITLTNPGAGETLPSTYKKIMWFKEGSFSGLGTDAWLINYAVGIGSTQFPTGTRLAAGNVQFTENDLAVVRNINSTGVSTLPTLDTTNATIDNLTFTSGTAITSVDTDLSTVSASDNTLASAKAIKSYVDGEVSTVNTTIGNIDLDFAGDTGTGAVDLDSQSLSIVGTSNEIETSASGQTLTIGLPNDVTIGQDLTVSRDVQIVRNLNVDGNITVGGTTAILFTQTLKVADADLILGIRTDGLGNDISTDNTANHGGIAIASTEGNPLITLTNPGVGETLPSTYKKIMWFKAGSFSGLGTDAWLINYAVGIGSTQFPTGTRLAAGNVQFTENDLAVVRNINSTGVSTLPTLDTTNATIDNLTFTSGTAITSVDTDLSTVSTSDDTLASAKAIKSYVDGEVSTVNTTIGNIDLDFAGDSGTGAVDLDSQTFTIAGTANEIETSGSGQTLTIGLPNEVAITTSLTAPKIYVGSGNEAYLDRANGSNGDLRIFSTNNIIFNLDTTDAVIFDYTQGYVGIGSTTPTEKLDVIGTAKVDGLKFGSGTAVTSVDTDLSSVSASDDTLASAKAIKSYVDAQATAQDLDFAGDTGSGSIDLDSETFTIVGTENEIQTVGSGNTLTIGLTETGVTADTYGSSTQVSQFTVDENGRITSASNVNINFSDANVATADSLTNSRNIAATGDIAWNVDFKGHEDVSGIATLSDTGVVAGTYGSSTQVGIVTVDSKGRITSASNVNINFSDANVATASQVSTGTTTGTTSYYPTFVDSNNSTRQNESLYTDAGISYNPNTNALNLTGALTVGGTLTANGNVDLGNNNSDTVTFTAKVDSNILPSTNNTRDLGSSSLKWNEVYATTVVGAIIGNADTADYATRAGLATDLAINASNRLLYQASNNNTGVLPAGTSGQLLKSNGTSAPSWVNASSVGKTYTLTAVDSGTNAILRLGDGTTNDDVKITAGSNITINPVAAGGFTIAASIPFNNYARAINTTRVLSYSATWVNTQTSVTINKQSSSSAIYITIEDALYAGNLGGHRLLRGSTVLVQSSANSFGATPSGSIGWYGRQSITYIDNTTATGNITYKTQIRLVTSNGFVAVNNNNLSGVNTRCTAVAIEI